MNQYCGQNYSCGQQKQRKNFQSKTCISKQIFFQQDRKKRRMHTNSILNELRLSEKINQQKLLKIQQRNLKRFQSNKNPFQKGRKNSIKRKSKIRLSELFQNDEHLKSDYRISCFKQQRNDLNSAHNQYKLNQKRQHQSQKNKCTTQNYKQKDQKLGQQEDLETNQKHKLLICRLKNITKINKSKIKQKNNSSDKQNYKTAFSTKGVLGSINVKVKQLNLISRIFDKVNLSYNINIDNNDQKYTNKQSQTDKILKYFGPKLSLRKNLITERKNSFKKNTKIQYRYKVRPKRFQTQMIENQSNELSTINNNQIAHNINQKYKIRGVWYQDAKKFKNYVTGGYSDQREEYSDFYNIELYKDLKKNFQTFQQIYNNIKQDKDNPIGKISSKQFKNPNLLQIVSLILVFSIECLKIDNKRAYVSLKVYLCSIDEISYPIR